MPQDHQVINTNLAHSNVAAKTAVMRPSWKQQPICEEDRPLDLTFFGSRKRILTDSDSQKQQKPRAASSTSMFPPQQLVLPPSPLLSTNETAFMPTFMQQAAPFSALLPALSPQQQMTALQQQINLPVPLVFLQQAAALGDLQALNYAQLLQRSAALASLTNQNSSKSAQKLPSNFVEPGFDLRGPFQSPPMTITPPPTKMARQQLPPQVIAQQQHQQQQRQQQQQQQQQQLLLQQQMLMNRPGSSEMAALRGHHQQLQQPILPRSSFAAAQTSANNGHHHEQNSHYQRPINNSWSDNTVKQVNTCLVCRRSFDSMNLLTAHMVESRHFKNIFNEPKVSSANAAYQLPQLPPLNVRRISNPAISPTTPATIPPASPSNFMPSDSRSQNMTVRQPPTMTPPITPINNRQVAAGQTVVREAPVFPVPSVQDDIVDVGDKLDGAKSEGSANNNSRPSPSDGKSLNGNCLDQLCKFVNATEPKLTSSPIKAVGMASTPAGNSSPFRKASSVE